MKIISAKFTYISGKFKENIAVAFNNKIVEIDSLEKLKSKYKDANVIIYNNNSILYPGFINAHTHLEFSANRATLTYGDFIKWLYSIIENRDDLVKELNSDIIDFAINQMRKSGVTTFGAISSFGADLKACVDTPLRVVYFNEVIGSNPAIIDALFSDFKQRLSESKKYKCDSFYPAVAIHSPYSVHPVLLRESLKIANEEGLITTAHFLESKAEKEWLENSSGDFLTFFEEFFKTTKPVNTIDGFLDSFQTPTLFTHATQAEKKELDKINKNNHTIIHCPRSNRLLNCGKLDIKNVKKLLIGTDGLSSNYSLNILDELKAAVMMHSDVNINDLALKLIEAITSNAADALGLMVGKIEKNYFADFAIFKLPMDLKTIEDSSLALNTIINCNRAEVVYIDGKEIK